jgi:hypothetical protein
VPDSVPGKWDGPRKAPQCGAPHFDTPAHEKRLLKSLFRTSPVQFATTEIYKAEFIQGSLSIQSGMP